MVRSGFHFTVVAQTTIQGPPFLNYLKMYHKYHEFNKPFIANPMRRIALLLRNFVF